MASPHTLGRSYGAPEIEIETEMRNAHLGCASRGQCPTGESLIKNYDNVIIAWETGSYGQIFSDFASRSRSRARRRD